MATKPGEENVATLFGDVHYFYSAAEVKPRHHRFDRGSYVYLFENAGERRCRVEIANNPGTSDQDAFEGFLDQTHVRYSYNHHCMVSISVADSVPQSQWHLPTYDPRNENKYHYKLHSLDIYFWTQQNALQFVNAIRRVLPPAQVEVLDEPAPPPQAAAADMSAVVQRLENVAITDPKYKNDQASMHSAHSGAHSVSRNSVGSQGDRRASSGAPAVAASSMPPPPPQTNFTPMAYNPAAPAAPETIRHREKTPPPDEDPLNPLAVAVAYDYQRQPFTPGPPPTAQFPPMNMGFPQFAAPPTHPAAHRVASAQGALPSPGLASPFGGEFAAAAPGYNTMPPPPPPPATAPVPAHAQALAPAPAPQPPVGGYSNYSYDHQASHPAQNFSVDYSIHQQAYRPTVEEAGHKMPSHQQPPAGSKGRLEENVGRLERGMSGMMKRFEKKFG